MTEFSVLSWNVQGRGRTILPFKKIAPALIEKNSDIVCLQEMPDAQNKLANIPALSSYWKFIPKYNNRSDKHIHGFNHNVLLSRHPIARAEEFIFPNFSKNNLPIESAIRAEIIINKIPIRFYVCHFAITKMGIFTRLKQAEYILADAISWQGPIVICGDMNAAMPKNQFFRKLVKWWHGWPSEEMNPGERYKKLSEREIFHQKIKAHGFKELLDPNLGTWSPFRAGWWEEFVKLKLDWFLIKNLQAEEAVLGEYISDHRPITVKCLIN